MTTSIDFDNCRIPKLHRFQYPVSLSDSTVLQSNQHNSKEPSQKNIEMDHCEPVVLQLPPEREVPTPVQYAR
jgi:hypothetical protein